MILLAVLIGTLTIFAGVFATRPQEKADDNGSETTVAFASSTATATTTVAFDAATGTGGGDPTTATSDALPTTTPFTTVESTQPSAPTTTSPVAEQPLGELPELTIVAKPELVAPTGPLNAVYGYYSESHDHDGITVAWRPGAFPVERAAEVATAAQGMRDRVNQILGLNDTDPMTIFLADRMFDDTCVGCQGFAAADHRQVFILQDGSVAPDEFPALLMHEIGHLLALHIALPEKLFFAEGLAVWISDEEIRNSGHISPMQTAAWAYKAGVLPSIWQLLDGQYAGRVRARVEYDGAASFTKFFIETYGLDNYKIMYDLVASERTGPESIVDTDWATLEQQWHAWLQPQADAEVNGVDATEWWSSGQAIAAGFGTLYNDPAPVTVEQYAALSAARWELNRGKIDTATALANISNLAPKTAN